MDGFPKSETEAAVMRNFAFLARASALKLLFFGGNIKGKKQQQLLSEEESP